MRVLKVLFVFCLFFLADACLKLYVHHSIPLLHPLSDYPYGGIACFKDLFGGINFTITHIHNQGAAWGILSNSPILLFSLRVLLVSYLLFLIVFRRPKHLLPLLLIVTGAIGNLVDLWIYGYVIDMFYFIFWDYSFAIFNLADAYISLGVVGALVFMRKEDRFKASS